MFQEKTQIQKTYWAIVKNRPEQDSGRLVHFLLRDTQKNKSTVVKKPVKDAKEAILEYELMAQSDNFYLLQINLLTGRHHQIRAQLAAIGCPIKGDLKYGFSRSNPDGGISLHARSIEFAHPVSKAQIKIVAPVPDDKLWQYFEQASQCK